MNIPGFQAEVSLYRTRNVYRAAYSTPVDNETTAAVLSGLPLFSFLRFPRPPGDFYIRVTPEELPNVSLAPPSAVIVDGSCYSRCYGGCIADRPDPTGCPQTCGTACRWDPNATVVAPCQIGQIPCGTKCCEAYQTCHDERCIVHSCNPGTTPCVLPLRPNDPPGTVPDVGCCPPGQYCCGGRCYIKTPTTCCCINKDTDYVAPCDLVIQNCCYNGCQARDVPCTPANPALYCEPS